jgi:predicted RNA polymerase sigma factor
VGQAQGPEEGLAEPGKIPDDSKLEEYPSYPAAHGEFHQLAGHTDAARSCFARASKLARNVSEARFLERKLKAIMASNA